MTKIGVIAEDKSDVEVTAELIHKYRAPRTFSLRCFVGEGCGKIKSKCGAWAKQLHLAGCSVLILVHDRDRHDFSALHADLTAALGTCPIMKRSIVIPIEEMEAWLLADAVALKRVFNLKKLPPVPANPEAISSPKERLQSLIWRQSGKTRRYINTVHNKIIAQHSSLSSLRKCSAFKTFESFIKQI